MRSLSFVFPVYNEEQNIRGVIASAAKIGKDLGIDYEIIAVNDGSADASLDVLNDLQKSLGVALKIINHKRNQGYGAALRHGFGAAKNEWVFYADSDNQFDLEEMKKLVTLSPQSDLIIGQRINRSDPLNRRINAWIYNSAMRMIFGLKTKDIDCGFKLIKKDLLSNTNLTATGSFISAEMLYKARLKGVNPIEVPVKHFERIYGRATGTDPKVIWTALKEILAAIIKKTIKPPNKNL